MLRAKKTFYERAQPKLVKLKTSVIIGIILVIFGFLLLMMRSKNGGTDATNGRLEDVEVSYVGSILFVGLAMIFV